MGPPPVQWFCALLDSAPDVYFRYALVPKRRFAYISPSVEILTGRSPDEFYADPDLCVSLVAPEEGRLLRRVLRSGRGMVLTLRVIRHNTAVPVELRTVAVTRHRRVVAVEGVARLAVAPVAGRTDHQPHAEPTQARLMTLMCEVHELLHRMLPPAGSSSAPAGANVLRLGDLAFDPDRLTATESGRAVALTSREAMVLRYLQQRAGRIVTRQQLLSDVWAYSYTGDARTVDVHVSRLRRKLPSLRLHLVAVKHVGYRLDLGQPAARVANS